MRIDDIEDEDLNEIYQLRKDASKHQADWREEARQVYEFREGSQWDTEDRAHLEEQSRPCVTFNRIGPVVDAIVGYEINNRREVRYRPRTIDDRQLNQTYSEVAEYVRDCCDAEDEESDAYRDAVTCGMGWTETRIDYDDDPDGKICVERVPPLEMRWDPSARKNNLADAEWVMREKWWDVEEARERYPDAEIHTQADTLAESGWGDDEHDASNAWQYRQDQHWFDPKEGKVLVIQYQYRERETYYRVGDPDSERNVDFTEKRFERIRDAIEAREIPYVRLRRWVYRQKIFTGATLLEEGPTPVDEGFSFHCITGKRDEEQGFWYGLVRPMLDPQRFANVFFSQAIYSLQSNSKGGVMYEQGAVEDPRQFEEQWADPAGVVQVEDGALSAGRIQPKPMGTYPPQLDRLMETAIQAIRDCTGVNLELLGMVGHEQTGILEQERKRSALTILAPLVNSLKRYRKIQGRILLAFIREYMTPGQIERITSRPAPPMEDDEGVQYDVIVDDATNSPNLKSEVWATFQNILPAMMRAGVPIPPSFIRFSPLPDTVADEWVQFVMQQQQQPDIEPMMQQMQQMQQQLGKLQQENQQLKDKREAQAMQLQYRAEEARLDAQIEQEKMALDLRKHEQEIVMKQQVSEADRQAKLVEIQARYETEMARIAEQANVQKETTALQVASQRDLQVINLENERERRALEREEKARKEMNPHISQIEDTASKLDDLREEFETDAEERKRKVAVVLKFLQSRGGEIAQVAKELQ